MEIQELRRLINDQGSIRAAARFLDTDGFSERNIRRILKRSVTSSFDVETVADVEPINVEALLARRAEEFKLRFDADKARKWHTIHMRSNAPIGLGIIGDLHLDDDGTDVGLAFQHAELFDGSIDGLYAGFLGDIWNNWVGRLQRLWADQSINAREAQALVQHYLETVNHLLFAVLGNHDCLSEDTECLTKRGWVHHSDIQDGDEILSYNPQTGEAEWHPILMKVTRPNTDPMVTVSSVAMDMMVTPNHRVLHAKRKHDGSFGGFDYVAASQVPHRFRIPVAGNTSIGSTLLTDDQIRLAAWILTDGCIAKPKDGKRNGSFSIYQSKDAGEIETLLERLGFTYSNYTRDRDIKTICGRELVTKCRPQTEFRISSKHFLEISAYLPSKGKLPQWVFELDNRQFDVLLETLIAGDGSWSTSVKDAQSSGVLHGTHEFLSSVQAAAVCHGWRAHLSIVREKDWRLNLSRGTTRDFERSQVVGEAPASPTVWCLTVPLTNFMVRRNGKSFFTGNCWNGKTDILEFMMASTADSVSAHGQRIRIVFPNGRDVRIHARHTFPGRSQWVTQFGTLKAAQLDGSCDIYTAGHIHTSGYSHGWHEGSERMWHALQVASYKALDDYPVELGLPKRDLYQCPVALIDPHASSPINFVRFEFDPFEGAERLQWMRSRH